MRIKNFFILPIILLFSIGSLSAQHYFGVRGGYGMGGIRPEPVMEKGYVSGLMSGGISWKYYSPVPYVGAIEIDVEYIEKGFKVLERVNSDTSFHHVTQNIQMPFMWQPHVYVFNRKGRIFMNLGVYLSYMTAADSSTVSKVNGILHEGKYPIQTVKDNIWGYGLTGGIGFSVLLGRFDMLVEARYNYGYSDLFKNFVKYPGKYKRSPVDQINVSFGLSYRIGKGGILEPQRVKRVKVEETEIITTSPPTTTTKLKKP